MSGAFEEQLVLLSKSSSSLHKVSSTSPGRAASSISKLSSESSSKRACARGEGKMGVLDSRCEGGRAELVGKEIGCCVVVVAAVVVEDRKSLEAAKEALLSVSSGSSAIEPSEGLLLKVDCRLDSRSVPGELVAEGERGCPEAGEEDGKVFKGRLVLIGGIEEREARSLVRPEGLMVAPRFVEASCDVSADGVTSGWSESSS